MFNKEPYISIGILSDKEIKFELYGDFSVQGFKQVFNGRFTAELKEGNITCKSAKDKIEISNEIIFEPEDPASDSFLVIDVPIGIKFHWERKEKQRFMGSLKILKDNDKIWLINILPVSQYLTSVISSEMSAKSSLQLLKAHAIVSGSWLLSQIDKAKSLKTKKEKYKSTYETENEIIKWVDREDHYLFDVCADDHCQRYQGITKISTENSRRAIEETKGIVLMHDKKICDTRYSKCCGGITEAYENAWEPVKHDYLSSIVDYKFEPENYNTDFSSEQNVRKWITGKPKSFCNTSDDKILTQVLLDYDQETKDFFRWKVEYTQDQLKKIIESKTGMDFGEIIDLVPIERGESARLIKLKIIGSKKTMTIGKELEIRKVLSETHLYSSAIVIDKKGEKNKPPEKFIIQGAGWGHGVGLCQIGAAVMASQGYQFDEIILHYFKNAKLKKIY
ncbi:MAG TPA: SpoIID/LytB domain-containing protein [Ignavibacteriaceae bacterium]|nr:SpoIID/LytB domain-containing protein [Ignavibacteriaceae bacterium]